MLHRISYKIEVNKFEAKNMYFGYLIEQKKEGNRVEYDKYLRWLEYTALAFDKVEAYKEAKRLGDEESIDFLLTKFPYVHGFAKSKL